MPTSTAAAPRIPSLSGFSSTIAGQVLLGLAGTLLVAAAARITIPLPFTPVPLTLQPLAVLGIGLALGPVTGFFSMLAYLAEGALGLPVFSPTGPGGLLQLLGPTGGYLMAYPLVAFIAGGVVRSLQHQAARRSSQFLAAAVACSTAVVVLFLLGAGWFMHYTHHSLQATWLGAVAPFLPGEAIKIFAAAGIYSALSRSSRI